MAIKRPSAKWTGIIEFPELSLRIDGGLYSVTRRGRTPLPVVMIHMSCQTKLAEPLTGDIEKSVPKQEEQIGVETELATITQITKQVSCPTCNRVLHTDEIGRAVETTIGLLQISDEELEELKPKKQKTISVRLIQGVAEALATIGTGRRFYLFPKASSVSDYYLLFEILRRSERVGFIPEIVVDRRPYVMIIQPIVTHPSVFGKLMKLLIVDEFTDTDTLRDPLEYQLLPAQEPAIPAESIAEGAFLARMINATLNPDQCVNPQRRRLKEFVQLKLNAKRVL